MTKDGFLSTLKDRLIGRKSTDTALDAIIGRQFDEVQVALELSGRRFSFQTAEASLAVAIDTTTPQVIALPTDFLSLVYEDALRLYDDATGDLLVVMNRRPYAELAKTFDGGRIYPIRYARVNKNLYLFPFNSTSAKTLKVFYHQSAALFSSLDGTVSNYWLTNAADYFLGTVGIVIATQVINLDNPQAIQLFAAQATLGSIRLEAKEASEEEEDSFHDEEAL